jgi:hypothetical protein
MRPKFPPVVAAKVNRLTLSKESVSYYKNPGENQSCGEGRMRERINAAFDILELLIVRLVLLVLLTLGAWALIRGKL